MITNRKEIKLYKAKSILDVTEKDSLYCLKADNETEFKIIVTDAFGNPVNLKDLTGGTITNIINTDGSITITGSGVKDIKLSTTLYNLINSAIQAGDNISSLTNDVGFITLGDIPNFNPSDYDLTDFTNSDVDPFARLSDIVSGSGIQSVVAGTNIVVDNTDPLNPVISSTASGATNLGYTPSPTDGIVTSDTGSDATIPLANGINSGLSKNNFTDGEKTKLFGIEAGAEVNNISDVDATDLTDGGETILHIHDSRYYTETEIDTFLSNKFDKPTGDNTEYLDGAGLPTTFPIIPDVSGFVPYTGATQDTDLGEYQIKFGQIEFDQSPTGSFGVGKMRWNDTDGTPEVRLKGNNVTLQLGQEQLVRVVNKTSPLIDLLESNYQVVMITGATGQRVSVKLAKGDIEANSAGTLGVVTETILGNQEGFITTSGQVRDINTTGSIQGETWVDGDILYLSPTVFGGITNVKPVAPNHTVIIGYVEYAHAVHGKIFIKVDNGYELGELHNVLISSAANNDGLFWDNATSLWKNKSIAIILGYTPANDADVVHKTGNETIAGDKDFTSRVQAESGFWYTLSGVYKGQIVNISDDTFYNVNSGRTHYFGMGNGVGIANVPNNASVPNGTFSILLQTANTIASFDANKNIVSLPLATYPSLTELSYVKGVTSAIQTQIDVVNVNVITITTAVSITTDTTSGSYGQHGRHVKISNGANVINIQCVSTSNADFVASYEKLGTSNITFTAGAGITLTTLSGTAILSGIAGSKACLSRNGNIYYLQITNY